MKGELNVEHQPFDDTFINGVNVVVFVVFLLFVFIGGIGVFGNLGDSFEMGREDLSYFALFYIGSLGIISQLFVYNLKHIFKKQIFIKAYESQKN